MKRAISTCIVIGAVSLLAALRAVPAPPVATVGTPGMAVATIRSVHLVFPH